jgi:hypothetical protein
MFYFSCREMPSFDPLQRLLCDARPPPSVAPSSTMALVLDLNMDDLDTFFAYTLLRVYDCLIFHHGYFDEMSRLDKKRYRCLANQEFVSVFTGAFG